MIARTESTTIDGVGERCCALEDYLVENASTERAFREDRMFKSKVQANWNGREQYSPNTTPPEFTTNKLHANGMCNKDPVLVRDAACEAARARNAVEGASEQCRHQTQSR